SEVDPVVMHAPLHRVAAEEGVPLDVVGAQVSNDVFARPPLLARNRLLPGHEHFSSRNAFQACRGNTGHYLVLVGSRPASFCPGASAGVPPGRAAASRPAAAPGTPPCPAR